MYFIPVALFVKDMGDPKFFEVIKRPLPIFRT